MYRSTKILLFGAALALASYGCANMVESRAIERFAAGLEGKDLKSLKDSTSPHFEERALRTADALDDLKILRIPEGKTSIVEVEIVDENRKRVTVEVGEQKREVFYELTKNEKGKWVVDDVFMKQKRKGVTAYKSVTEQMDLLLTVREFVDGWDEGSRDDILKLTTADFRDTLSKLPPGHLARMKKFVVSGQRGRSERPQASMEETTAVVRLPRPEGETVLTLTLEGGDWRVSDMAVDSRNEEEQIPSVQKQSIAVLRCLEFLEAYERADKARLQEICQPAFYEGAVALGSPDEAPLPSPVLTSHDLQIRVRGTRVDCSLTGESTLVQVAMHRAEGDDPSVIETHPKYFVSDVTIYDIATRQEKNLSAVFTGKAMMEVFAQALVERDLQMLRHSSTYDFKTRVWEKLDDQTVPGLPLELFSTGISEVVKTNYEGTLARISVKQNDALVTYYMRQQGGQFLVDDVETEIPGRPLSLKSLLDVSIPVQQFAVAVSLGRQPDCQKPALESLQKVCSNDFNRVVWRQTKFVPNSGMSADTFLSAPVKKVAITEKGATLLLGDARYGAKVELIKENERYVVDDVTLVAGEDEGQRMALKHTLRTQLALGQAKGPTMIAREERVPTIAPDGNTIRDAAVRPASAAEEEPAMESSVQSAGFEEPAEEAAALETPAAFEETSAEPAALPTSDEPAFSPEPGAFGEQSEPE